MIDFWKAVEEAQMPDEGDFDVDGSPGGNVSKGLSNLNIPGR